MKAPTYSAGYGSFNISAQEVEEVVVTATRREESIQDVALSVQALTADALTSAQVTEMQDLAELVPGFSYQSVLGSGNLYTVRGASSAAVGAGTASSVQTAINGHTAAGSAIVLDGFNLIFIGELSSPSMLLSLSFISK